jgi:hypothetical protein
MKTFGIALTVLSLSAGAFATEACGHRVANLLSAGKTEQLAALFKNSSPSTVSQVTEISRQSGALADLVEVNVPRFKAHIRYTALSEGLPDSFKSIGVWVNATSARRGLVRSKFKWQWCRILPAPSWRCT